MYISICLKIWLYVQNFLEIDMSMSFYWRSAIWGQQTGLSEKFFSWKFSNRCPGSERRKISNVRYSIESLSLGLITAGGVCFCDNSPLHGSQSRGELVNRGRKTDANRKTFLSSEIRSRRNNTKCSSHQDLHFGILYVHFRNGVTNPTSSWPRAARYYTERVLS